MNVLAFSKMHGLGNDFVVIDAVTQTCPPLTVSQRQWLADRHRGVGCDQILLVEEATQAGVDFKYRIFNADGSEVSQCGNGARCFARFVTDKGLTNKDKIVVETLSGVITLLVEQQGEIVTVNMGCPDWVPEHLPFEAEGQQRLYTLVLPSNESVKIDAVSMGNPHAVTWVEDILTANIAEWGPMIEGHNRFPERVNAGFAEIVDRQHIKLRVYERGAGETQACGTGACAAAVAGIQQGLLDNKVMVHLTGGTLQIEWQGHHEPVLMTGSASHVFDGELAWATITAQ